MRKGRLLDPARQQRQRLADSQKQEEQTAAVIGGKRQPASGSRWHSKLDVKSKSLLVENKRTDSGRFTLKSLDLRRYRLMAIKEGKKFAMQIDLSDDPRDRYMLIPLDDFEVK